MKYDLPDIPKGQRWRLTPASIKGLSRICLEEKRWYGWKRLDFTVVRDEHINRDIYASAQRLLERRAEVIEYGIKEGTL